MAGLHYNAENLNGSSGLVPKGVIAIWSGSIDSIPSGWALCNGSNGTPDLRDRFIVGAGSSYSVGAKGGTTSANHSHSYSFTTGTGSTTSIPDNASQRDGARGNHTHTGSGTSSSVTLDNRPPFYALAFIMKL